MIRLIIADDQRILAEGIKMLLSGHERINVVGIAENGLEAVELCEALKPDVVLMDIQMPILNGVDAIKQIKSKWGNIKCLILTTFSDDEYIFEGIKNGASGYLLKDSSPREIESAILSVADGGTPLAPEVTSKMVERMAKMMTVPNSMPSNAFSLAEQIQEAKDLGLFETLTDRELEIVALVAEGLSNLEIAETLYLTEGTVKNHLTKILQKVELRDRTQLAVTWLKK